MFVNFSGLGNAVVVAGLLRALERSGVGWTYFHNAIPGLDDPELCKIAGLRNLGALYPAQWRRFCPSDADAIRCFIRQHGVDTVINLRNEGPKRDIGYVEFKRATRDRLDFFDLDDQYSDNAIASRNLFARQYELLRSAGAPVIAESAWLRPLVNVARNPRSVALFTSASQAVKCWPEHCWLELAGRLHHLYELPLVLIAGISDVERRETHALFAAIRARNPGVRLAIAESDRLLDTIRVIAQAEVLISNDTSAVHIAASVGVPTIGLYFSTSASVWGGFSPVFRAVQSQAGLQCPEQKVGTGNCLRFNGVCEAPCKNEIESGHVVHALHELVGERLRLVHVPAE